MLPVNTLQSGVPLIKFLEILKSLNINNPLGTIGNSISFIDSLQLITHSEFLYKFPEPNPKIIRTD